MGDIFGGSVDAITIPIFPPPAFYRHQRFHSHKRTVQVIEASSESRTLPPTASLPGSTPTKNTRWTRTPSLPGISYTAWYINLS